MKKQFMAFTLAEVLITLAIIGIVAALTIPSLMANYQKTQYVAGLKKAYAEITEALKLMASDHGCPDNLKCTNLFNNNSNALGNEVKKYFKLAKDCGSTYNANDESTKCFSDTYRTKIDGSGDIYNSGEEFDGSYNFITADGFAISLTSDNCDSSNGSGPNRNMNNICGFITIDVNGAKGPNNVGRDIFSYLITNGKGPALYPSGGSENPDGGWADLSGTPQYCTEGSPDSLDGWECSGRIMEQGWQMKY